MAEKTEVLQFRWENNNHFKLRVVPEEGEPFLVVHANENSSMEANWDHITRMCQQYVETLLKRIGEEMKLP